RCRFQARFRVPAAHPPLEPLELPPVNRLFHSVGHDPELGVTEFIWGLDRHFMTRQVEAARLIYRDADQQNPRRVALGHHYTTAGVRYEVDLRPHSPIGDFLDQVESHKESAVYQAVLEYSLYAFLAENARNPQVAGTPWWIEASRPSVFTVRTLKTLIHFHLLERWHPEPETQASPTTPPIVDFDGIVGCFTPQHANFIDQARFERLCRWVAGVQNPASVHERETRLLESYANFQAACQRIGQFTRTFMRQSAEELLLNSLGITLHAAALQLTGAESGDLAYFYKRRHDIPSEIYLFDTDELGNGTIDLLIRTFYVSPPE